MRPEDGDSMFLQNVCIYLQVHTQSQPRGTSLTEGAHFIHVMCSFIDVLCIEASDELHPFSSPLRIQKVLQMTMTGSERLRHPSPGIAVAFCNDVPSVRTHGRDTHFNQSVLLL
jgi:hypothetical protein